MPYSEQRLTLSQRLGRLQENVNIAQERRDLNKQVWEDTHSFYQSDPPTSYDPEGYRLQVNYPWAWYESMMPSLVYRNPVFTAVPQSQESEESAPTVEAAVTAELRSIDFKKTLKKAVHDTLLYGVGIIQLGYYDTALVPTSVGGAQPNTPESVASEGPRDSSDLPYGIRPGQIYALHIRPQNFMIDPCATSLSDALWCCVEYVRDLEAVKRDPQYQNTGNLEADEWDCPPGMTVSEFTSKYKREPERRFVRLYQYWDMVDKKVYTFTKNNDKFLGSQPMRLQTRRYPFYIMHGTDDNENFWTQSPMVPWLNLVDEYNLTLSSRLNHLHRFKRKYTYDMDRIDDEQIDALIHPKDGTLVGVHAAGGNVAGSVVPVPDANVSPDSYAFTAEIKQRWTEISGMSEFDLGGTRAGERSASEIGRIAGAANARRSGVGERITSTLEYFAEDVRSVMAQYYSKEKVVQITGDRGNTVWVPFEGSDLEGNYEWKCMIEDMAEETREERLAKSGQILQMLTPYSQAGSPVPMIDIRPQLQKVAQELGVRDLRFLPESGPLMDPGQEWYLMLKKGLALQPNEQDDHEWHIFVHEEQLTDTKTLQSQSTLERLQNHLEAHRAMLFAQQQAAAGMQQVQQQRQAPGGTPGPGQGNTNNPSGGAGVFAGGSPQTPEQMASGGATGQNMQELLRGGF